MTGLDRLIAGRETFSRAITLLLTRNGLSHAAMAAAASWANPDGRNWLSTSQISYFRTAHNKLLGPRPADALGQLNLAMAMLAGHDSDAAQAMTHLGKPPGDLARLLQDPFFLRHPATHEPMNAGDLFMVWIGRLVPLELTAEQLPDPSEFSAAVSRVCQDWFVEQELPLREGLQQLIRHYPSKDPERISMLQSVVAGFAEWDAEQLRVEMESLAAMLGDSMAGHRLTPRELLKMLYEPSSAPSIAESSGRALPPSR